MGRTKRGTPGSSLIAQVAIDVTIGNVCRTGFSHYHRHSAANGSAALVAMALAGGDGARCHVGVGWTGSVHRRRARPRPHPYHDVASDGIEVGLAASAYLAGSVVGAVLFSYLTDRQGGRNGS